MALTINTKLAKKVSYGGTRKLNSIKYIVIHYTGNKGDSAKGNATYFATSNTRQAGAHFFVDEEGIVYKSIPMSRVAWAVGGFYTSKNGAASYYKKCTNTNSVSIELCNLTGQASWNQMKACQELVTYIQKNCPNAKTIIRHWDVNGKSCPYSMIGNSSKTWKHFKNKITKGYMYKGTLKKDVKYRSAGNSSAKILGTITKGKTVVVSKVVGKWGRLYNKDSKGNYRWIPLSAVKEN